LDAVLELTPEERRRVPEAFTATFLSATERRGVVSYTDVKELLEGQGMEPGEESSAG
jgi:hypothetical protein